MFCIDTATYEIAANPQQLSLPLPNAGRCVLDIVFIGASQIQWNIVLVQVRYNGTEERKRGKELYWPTQQQLLHALNLLSTLQHAEIL
jgi:hypothetical protein